MNGKTSMFSMCPPFALSLSKGERGVFQQNPSLMLDPFAFSALHNENCKSSYIEHGV